MEELRFRPGDVIADRFRVERVIGHGGFGLVVAAFHLHLEELVAVKLLRPDLVGKEEVVSRFLREARACVRLRSEHVARVMDAGRLDNGTPYIVMEYLEGEDLQRLVERRKAIPAAEAVEYIRQACEGVAEAHEKGIIHRDLKPANLFLTTSSKGRPLIKVLDFGIAKAEWLHNQTTPHTATGVAMGSPAYMAPEQIRSAKHVDIRADVWGLGATLYYLLAGRPPYRGSFLPDVYIKILEQPPDDLGTGVSSELARVVVKCLSKTPDGRYADVPELVEALQPYSTGSEPIAALPDTDRTEHRAVPAAASEDTYAPESSRRIAVWIAIGAIAIGIVAGVLVFRGGDETGHTAGEATVAIDAAVDIDAAVEIDATSPEVTHSPDASAPDAAVPDAAPPDAASASRTQPRKDSKRRKPKPDERKDPSDRRDPRDRRN